MSNRTKWWIKATRVIQMGLRVLELIAAIGVLVLFILMNKMDDLTAWVMRITVGIRVPFTPLSCRLTPARLG